MILYEYIICSCNIAIKSIFIIYSQKIYIHIHHIHICTSKWQNAHYTMLSCSQDQWRELLEEANTGGHELWVIFWVAKLHPCNRWEKCMRDWLSSCSPMSFDVVFDLPTGWTTCYSKVVKAFRFNACQAKHPNAQVEKSRSLVAALLKLDKKLTDYVFFSVCMTTEV